MALPAAAAAVALLAVLFFLSPFQNLLAPCWSNWDSTDRQVRTGKSPCNYLESTPQKTAVQDPPTVSPTLVLPQASSESSASPSPAPSPGPRRPRTSAKYTVLVVKRGQTLSELVRNVYGPTTKEVVDGSALELVKQHNPSIRNTNLIVAGSMIRFPNCQQAIETSKALQPSELCRHALHIFT